MAAFLCDVCHKSFSHQYNVTKHKKTVHKINIPAKTIINCLECGCDPFHCLRSLREHLFYVHDMHHIKEVQKVFKSFPEFLQWKTEFEKSTGSEYRLLNKNTDQTESKVYKYICKRSGSFRTKGKGKRQIKSPQSCKLGIYCTAFITAVDNGEKIAITFGDQHYGHTTDLPHFRLSQSKRLRVASKRRAGVISQSVIEDVIRNFDDEEAETISTLEFLMQVGKLKHLKRTGWVNNGISDCETVSGHMYRMGIMAFLLNKHADKELNQDKCIRMALIHDLAECIVGDLTPFSGVSKEEKFRREMDAMKKLCDLAGKKIGQEMLELFKEYEAHESKEAKAVKDLDRFDMILQAYEYETDRNKPKSLQEFFDSTEGSIENAEILKWVEQLKKLREKTGS